MAGRKSDFTLTKLDDLFTTQAQREEEKLSKIRDIPLELIDDFPDHPFKVRDDEDMLQLIESIRDRGVITPATVRQKEDGRYELISGHRRKRASELSGFQILRCEMQYRRARLNWLRLRSQTWLRRVRFLWKKQERYSLA